ncbi:MAG: adenylyl-sulfate kinase [Spirochaetes bacterium]|nr:adenylyl-sulfate kinase [Spirochaetota bacterium]
MKNETTHSALDGGDDARMGIVIVGHVDHGKSTVIGRLLYDTGSLPDGKLEQVRKNCERNAKPFELAFLLDALKDEQSQGITIDSARCFFHTKKRPYIVIDAPGHIEFLKNMISGASRAEAALLVIDAKEGVRENSKRHGYLLSFLGIRQVAVLINKMDLVGYDKTVFDRLRSEYGAFLSSIGVVPEAYVPVCARDGDNFTSRSEQMPWYSGRSVLAIIDDFKKESSREKNPLRFPLQDIYKFTEEKDDRRIFAGTVESGSLSIGDEIVFLPSDKSARIRSIERFPHGAGTPVAAGYSTGITLDTEMYLTPGALGYKRGEPPPTAARTFQAKLFWLGRNPMLMDKKYKLKINTNKSSAYLEKIIRVMDASDLTASQTKSQIDRHDVAECIIKTLKPIAFDRFDDVPSCGRFVIVDDYEIVGGGVITAALTNERSYLEEHVALRETQWVRGGIRPKDRSERFMQTPRFLVITGNDGSEHEIARRLEEQLFREKRNVYYLGMKSIMSGLESDQRTGGDRDEMLRRLGELAHILTDAGLIFITTTDRIDDYERELLKTLNEPNEVLFYETIPATDIDVSVGKIIRMLYDKNVLLEYYL